MICIGLDRGILVLAFLGSNFLRDTKASVTLDLLIDNLVNGQDSDCPETRFAYQEIALFVLAKPLIKAVD